MSIVIKAFGATVQIGLSTAIEGYHLSDGTFRYGLNYISVLLGHAENYFLRLTKIGCKKLEALQSKGYTSYLIPVKVTREGKRGATVVETVSFNDFCILVEYEANVEENSKAIALLTASFREVLRSRTQEAFGLPEDSFETKIAFFELSYSERERLLSEDKKDLEQLELFGNQELVKIDPWWKHLEKIYKNSEAPSLEL